MEAVRSPPRAPPNSKRRKVDNDLDWSPSKEKEHARSKLAKSVRVQVDGAIKAAASGDEKALAYLCIRIRSEVWTEMFPDESEDLELREWVEAMVEHVFTHHNIYAVIVASQASGD